MKKLAYILAAAALVFSCAKEEIDHPSEGEVPEAASYEPVIAVDQEINQVTFSVDAKGIVPVWVFQASDETWSEYHAGNGFKKIFTKSGDYSVRMHVMNAAGMSPDYTQKTFHIDNTLANYDKYITFLAGGTAAENTKDWHIDGSVENNMGCGPAGTDGLEWWHAGIGEKAAFGVYEDIMTFGGDGAYTYNPGEDGATYVNKGVTVEPFISQKGDNTEDYNAAVSEQSSTYKFETRGDDLYLVLAENTLFPYIDNDAFWSAPEFKVLSASRESFELVHDEGSIAWHYIITSKAGPVVFNGFKYNADSNIWLPADSAHEFSFYYAPGWSQIADPETSFDGGEYTLVLPSATSDQWQAQFHIIPTAPVILTADKHYDFSVIVNATKDIPNMTFKLTDVGDDGNFLFAERENVKAGEQLIFYRTDLAGIDAPNGVKMVFDFGGNPDGTTVSLARIVLKDHAVDDGTVLPGTDDPGEQPGGYTYGDNLLGGLYLKETWFSPADWSGGLDPNATFEGGKLTLTVPDGVGGGEWQGQVKLVADIPADPEKRYAFFANIESSTDGTFTVKLADANDDSAHAFFYDNNAKLAAFTPLAYKNEPVSPDQAYEAVMVIFDFGRMAAGTEISVSGIELKEITGESQGGGSATYGEELLGGIYLKETWFSPADWSGGLDPNAKFEGGKLTLTVPDGVGGGEWQGQVKLVADIPADPAKQYSFSAVLESSVGAPVTVKLADANDDSNHAFFYVNNVNLEAYTPLTYKNEPVSPDQAYEAVMVIFDFGRVPAGAEITVSGISLREVTGTAGGGEQGGDTGNYGDNLFSGQGTLETWFSPADWSGGLDPQGSYADGKVTLTVPEGTGGNEWNGQVKIHTGIAIESGKNYSFKATVSSSAAGTFTSKLTSDNDPGGNEFFYDNACSVAAYDSFTVSKAPVSMVIDDQTFMIIFDFGRMPVGAEIEISGIEIRPEV